MVCSIADNTPLKKLERELKITPRCHGKRRECIQGFETSSGDFVLGLPGTALGYCQALFNNAGDPARNTAHVLKLLEDIEAPWSHSHELYWGYRQNETAAEYVEQGIQPLLGTGRVPILITGLDPKEHRPEIENIMATSPALPQNETVLVRTVLSDDRSCLEITDMIRNLLNRARTTGKMPMWWPLLQANYSVAQWNELAEQLGDDWSYVNIAVNPFVQEDAMDYLRDQITVAQIAIGSASDVGTDGTIRLPATMKLTGATNPAAYSLFDYVERLSKLLLPPALIVLGPAQPGWSDIDNQNRVAKLLPLLRQACNKLWRSLPPARRDEVWEMAA